MGGWKEARTPKEVTPAMCISDLGRNIDPGTDKKAVGVKRLNLPKNEDASWPASDTRKSTYTGMTILLKKCTVEKFADTGKHIQRVEKTNVVFTPTLKI